MSGLANLRDVAEGVAPGALRQGKLLRSDAPMQGDAVPSLAGWPPDAVIDLRDAGEREGSHPLAGVGTTVHSIPLFAGAAPTKITDRGHDPGRLERTYRTIVNGPPTRVLVEVVRLVATTTGPTLIHCAAGKDRTGISVALILRLCGIDRAAVVAEYLLTARRRDALLTRHRHHFGLVDAAGDLDPELARDFLLTTDGPITAVLDVWDAHPGGVAGWYCEHGGAEPSLRELRAALTPFGRLSQGADASSDRASPATDKIG